MIRFRDSESGFTVLELLLAVAIASIISTVLLSISITYYGAVVQSNHTTELYVEAQQTLRAIIEDIRLADSIQDVNAISDSNAPGGGWATSDASNVLIIGSPALTSNRDIIYDDTTGNPYRNELIYFVQGTQLYRRTLKNTAATGNVAVTTCPAASATSTCPADKDYSHHITNFTLALYDADNVATADPTLARSVRLGIQLSRKSSGKTITINDTIRATLRNK